MSQSILKIYKGTGRCDQVRRCLVRYPREIICIKKQILIIIIIITIIVIIIIVVIILTRYIHQSNEMDQDLSISVRFESQIHHKSNDSEVILSIHKAC